MRRRKRPGRTDEAALWAEHRRWLAQLAGDDSDEADEDSSPWQRNVTDSSADGQQRDRKDSVGSSVTVFPGDMEGVPTVRFAEPPEADESDESLLQRIDVVHRPVGTAARPLQQRLQWQQGLLLKEQDDHEAARQGQQPATSSRPKSPQRLQRQQQQVEQQQFLPQRSALARLQPHVQQQQQEEHHHELQHQPQQQQQQQLLWQLQQHPQPQHQQHHHQHQHRQQHYSQQQLQQHQQFQQLQPQLQPQQQQPQQQQKPQQQQQPQEQPKHQSLAPQQELDENLNAPEQLSLDERVRQGFPMQIPRMSKSFETLQPAGSLLRKPVALEPQQSRDQQQPAKQMLQSQDHSHASDVGPAWSEQPYRERGLSLQQRHILQRRAMEDRRQRSEHLFRRSLAAPAGPAGSVQLLEEKLPSPKSGAKAKLQDGEPEPTGNVSRPSTSDQIRKPDRLSVQIAPGKAKDADQWTVVGKDKDCLDKRPPSSVDEHVQEEAYDGNGKRSKTEGSFEDEFDSTDASLADAVATGNPVPCLHKRTAQWFEVRLFLRHGRGVGGKASPDSKEQEELELLPALQHPNLVALASLYLQHRVLYAVRPHLEDARPLLHAPVSILGSAAFASEVARQLLGAVAYCHRSGVCHLGLGVQEGILVEPPLEDGASPVVLLCDVGMRQHIPWPRQGEKVEVFSRGGNAWLDGIVQALALDDSIMDGYGVDAGTVKVSYGDGKLKYIPPDQVASNIRRPRQSPEPARFAPPTGPSENAPRSPGEAVADAATAAFCWGLGNGLEMTLPKLLAAAPEIIGGGDASPASDIWSIGVIVFLLMCGEFPYSENVDWQQASPDDLLQAVQTQPALKLLGASDGADSSPNSGSRGETTHDLVTEFCQQLLRPAPRERPAAEEAARHPWIASQLGSAGSSKVASTAHQRTFFALRRLVDVLDLRRRSVALVTKQLIKARVHRQLGVAFVQHDDASSARRRVPKEEFEDALQALSIAPGAAASVAAAFMSTEASDGAGPDGVAYLEFIREVAAHARHHPQLDGADPMTATPVSDWSRPHEAGGSAGGVGSDGQGSASSTQHRAQQKSRPGHARPSSRSTPPPMPSRPGRPPASPGPMKGTLLRRGPQPEQEEQAEPPRRSMSLPPAATVGEAPRPDQISLQ